MLEWRKVMVLVAALSLGVSGAAAQDEVVMAVWGGGGALTWRDAYIKDFPPSANVSIKIAEVPNTAGVIRSPAAASQYHLALVTYFEAIALMNARLLEGFDPGELPGLTETNPKYLTKDNAGRYIGVPAYFTFYGIAINTDLAKPEEFASWRNLADARWKGRIAVTRPVYLAPYDAVVMAKAMGGDAKNIEPGFELLREIMPNVLTTYTSLAHMNTLLTRGEVAAVPFYASRVWSLRRHGAKNVAIVMPKDGVLMLPYVVVAPKGVRNRPGILKWLNYIASAEPQLRAAKLDGWLPMNTNVKLPGELETELGIRLQDIMDRLYSPDWSLIVAANEERINRAEKLTARISK